jgi:hypothetical protein
MLMLLLLQMLLLHLMMMLLQMLLLHLMMMLLHLMLLLLLMTAETTRACVTALRRRGDQPVKLGGILALTGHNRVARDQKSAGAVTLLRAS